MRLRQSGLVTASQTLETAFPTLTRRKSRSQMRAIVCLALSLGVQLTLNFGFERTHVLPRMNSNKCSLQISKSKTKMRGTQATSALIKRQTLQTIERTNSPMADAVDSFLRLPFSNFFYISFLFIEVAASSCLFYAVCRSMLLCTCACAVDTLYSHGPHPKACTEDAVVSSMFSHAVELHFSCSSGCRV